MSIPAKVAEGVTFDDVVTAERPALDGELLTSFMRLAVEELGFGMEVRAVDDGAPVAYADATADWAFDGPDGVDALADFFDVKMIPALRAFASEWRDKIADGTIPAPSEGDKA